MALFLLFEQEVLHFCFAPDLTKYGAVPGPRRRYRASPPLHGGLWRRLPYFLRHFPSLHMRHLSFPNGDSIPSCILSVPFFSTLS